MAGVKIGGNSDDEGDDQAMGDMQLEGFDDDDFAQDLDVSNYDAEMMEGFEDNSEDEDQAQASFDKR